ATPVGRLVGMNRTLQDALIASDRLFEILDLEMEGEGAASLSQPRGKVIELRGGDVELRGVTFRYGGRLKVLDRLDLRIRKGETTAVVGESGCGKSTLAALLQRLYAPSEGQVLIGGVDLRSLPLSAIRRHVAIVPQDIHLI